MVKVIFLNGPPRSGKDTVGEIIETLVSGAECTKMAHALKVATHCLFRAMHGRLTPATLSTALFDDIYEDMKDQSIPLFYDKTPREAYIAVSEQLIKPMFGEEFWGKIVADQIEASPNIPLWLITDSGFEPETRPIIKLVGAENCMIMRIHRDGCDFSNDSRGYIYLDDDIDCLDLYNDGSIDDLVASLRTQMDCRFA